jgi:hypothetical protein
MMCFSCLYLPQITGSDQPVKASEPEVVAEQQRIRHAAQAEALSAEDS